MQCDNCGTTRSSTWSVCSRWRYPSRSTLCGACDATRFRLLRRWFVRFHLPVLLLALGFFAAWEAQSRFLLPRIPQPDDVTLEFSTAPVWSPTVVNAPSPCGGIAIVQSTYFDRMVRFDLKDWSSERALVVDGIAFCATAIYTYDAGGRRWFEWKKSAEPAK